MLLLATKSEETSFWLLKVLVEKILPDYYTRTMDGLIVDIEVLSELVKVKVPDVHQHVINLGEYTTCFLKAHLNNSHGTKVQVNQQRNQNLLEVAI